MVGVVGEPAGVVLAAAAAASLLVDAACYCCVVGVIESPLNLYQGDIGAKVDSDLYAEFRDDDGRFPSCSSSSSVQLLEPFSLSHTLTQRFTQLFLMVSQYRKRASGSVDLKSTGSGF